MQKNKYLFIIFSSVLLAATGSSCKKILTQEPKNSTYLEVYWKSAADCEYAIAGNYALLRDAFTDFHNRYYMYGDAQASPYFGIHYTGDGLENIEGGGWTFKYDVEGMGDWTKYYKAIAMSNLILQKVPTISDEVMGKTVADVPAYRNKIMGEALFLRALVYFELVKIYGDVPLVTVSYDDPLKAPQLPRSPKADVLAQIEKDAKAAAGLLVWGYEAKQDIAVRANRASVYGLLAHMYLWRATTTNMATPDPIMADVDNASNSIDSITMKGGYSLVDTADYLKQFSSRSSESIFEIAMSEDSKEGSNRHIGMEFLTNLYINGYGTGHRFWVLPSYLSSHYHFDAFNKDSAALGIDLTDTFDIRFIHNFDQIHEPEPICRKYSNVSYRNAGAQTDPFLSNNMILFRLSDMILLKAEIALYRNDLGSAVTIINDFRERNGAALRYRVDNTYSKDDLMYEYVLERGKELYLEGHLYYDLIRTRQYGNFIPWLSDSRFREEGIYWPINPLLFNDNRFLTQTKYWRGKV